MVAGEDQVILKFHETYHTSFVFFLKINFTNIFYMSGGFGGLFGSSNKNSGSSWSIFGGGKKKNKNPQSSYPKQQYGSNVGGSNSYPKQQYNNVGGTNYNNRNNIGGGGWNNPGNNRNTGYGSTNNRGGYGGNRYEIKLTLCNIFKSKIN